MIVPEDSPFPLQLQDLAAIPFYSGLPPAPGSTAQHSTAFTGKKMAVPLYFHLQSRVRPTHIRHISILVARACRYPPPAPQINILVGTGYHARQARAGCGLWMWGGFREAAGQSDREAHGI